MKSIVLPPILLQAIGSCRYKADWNAWYSAEERGHGLAKSPFKKFRSNPGVSLAIGKWFTPSIGLRTKLQGIWGKKVDADWNDGLA